MFGRNLTLLLVLLLASCASTATAPAFDFGANSPEALEAHELGWAQIMDQGRWTAAEASFRRARELDPDWVMGAALVARITHDVDEREELLSWIEDRRASVDADSALLLDVYLVNLRASNARDRGQALPEDFGESRTRLAVRNFARFVERHPGAAYACAEYVEWVHAAEGAQAALDLMANGLSAGVRTTPFLIAYAALMEGELGRHERADALARDYEASLSDPEAPGIDALWAALHEQRGELDRALVRAERAVERDPRHLVVVALRDRLIAAAAPAEGEAPPAVR